MKKINIIWMMAIILMISAVFASTETLTANVKVYAVGYSNTTITTVANTPYNVNATTASNATVDLYTNSNITNSSIYLGVTNQSLIVGVPSDYTAIGQYVTIEPSIVINSSLSMASIRIYYADVDRSQSGGTVTESTLRMFYWNETSNNSWVALTTSGVNTTNNYVWGNSTHFSIFGIFGTIPSTSSTSSSSRGSGGWKCSGEWECGDWGECIGGKRRRTCSYSGTCSSERTKPAEEESCQMPVVEEEPSVEEKPVSIPKEQPIIGELKEEEKAKIEIPLGAEIAVLVFLVALTIVVVVVRKHKK